jgi:hypothetical protein
MKLGSISVGDSVLKTIDTGEVLIRNRLAMCPFTIRIEVPILSHMNPINTLPPNLRFHGSRHKLKIQC